MRPQMAPMHNEGMKIPAGTLMPNVKMVMTSLNNRARANCHMAVYTCQLKKYFYKRIVFAIGRFGFKSWEKFPLKCDFLFVFGLIYSWHHLKPKPPLFTKHCGLFFQLLKPPKSFYFKLNTKDLGSKAGLVGNHLMFILDDLQKFGFFCLVDAKMFPWSLVFVGT